MLTLEALDPLDLLLSLGFLIHFLSLTTFLSQKIVIDLSLFLNRHHDRIKFHLIVVSHGSVDSIDGKELICLCIGAMHTSRV